MISRPTALFICMIVLAFFAVFFILPVWETLQGGLYDASRGEFTFSFVEAVFKNPIYVQGLANSVAVAVCTTLLVMLLAIPLAWIADRYNFAGKGILTALILVPMILPPFVGAIGLRYILGHYGALNALLQAVHILGPEERIDWLANGRFWGVVIAQSLGLYPIMYLNAVAAMANVDPAMEEAAEDLGCTGLRKFFSITLPLIMPGLFAGATIVFIWSFTELGTPLMFDYTRIASVQIFDGLKEIGSNPIPYALVLVVLCVSLLLFALSRAVFGRGGHAMLSKATIARVTRTPSGSGRVLLALPFVLVISLAILPHIGVVFVSIGDDWYDHIVPASFTLGHFNDALSHGLTVPSISNSLTYAGWAMVIDVFLGLAIAVVVVRSTLPGRSLLDSLAMLPLAVPGLVLAFGYLAASQQGGPLEMLVGDPKNPDPLLLLIVAYAVRRLPFVVRSSVAGLQQTSVSLDEAAANLGAGLFTRLRRITVPLISANILAGAMLAFAFAMLEVSDSLILAQRQADYPITKAIFELFQLLGEGQYIAAALGVWAMVFLATTIIGVSTLLGKRFGAIFRI